MKDYETGWSREDRFLMNVIRMDLFNINEESKNRCFQCSGKWIESIVNEKTPICPVCLVKNKHMSLHKILEENVQHAKPGDLPEGWGKVNGKKF